MSGQITFDGKPLRQGVINFFPADDNRGPTAGATIVNGRFNIEAKTGVALGMNRVTVNSKEKTGRKVARFGPADNEESTHDELAEQIPDCYNTNSRLTFKTERGRNEFNIDLQSDPP
ncbi:MAG: hypothetical protein IT427_03275 [Pirellulales bacterium]|nr:hypothetical protein [Pirellulales bacterium]